MLAGMVPSDGKNYTFHKIYQQKINMNFLWFQDKVRWNGINREQNCIQVH